MWPWTKIKEVQAQLAGAEESRASIEIMLNDQRRLAEEHCDTIAELKAKITELEDRVEVPSDENTPWFKMWTEGFHENLGIQIRMDWNNAMIAYLKQNGVDKGPEEMRIQKWLSFTLAGIIQDLDAKSIEMLSRQTESEFK